MKPNESAFLWRRVWAICHDAEAIDPEDLDSWIGKACATEAKLEQAVRSLLIPDATAGTPGARPQDIGPYNIEALLGTGGLGRVYRAKHREMAKLVAIKLLPFDPSADQDRERARRFRREVQTLARLDHPGIVQIFDAGTDTAAAGGPFRWFAMQLVDQPRTLAEYVREERPDPRRLIELWAEACDAIAHAHQHDVLHRDIKPSNLLVDFRGRLRVIDFGIAQMIGDEMADLTRTGSIVGTLNYLAPERVDGERATAASDVYALGLVLEEVLSGRRRFDYSDTASGISSLRDAQQYPAKPIALEASLPVELDWIIAKATDPTPSRRYADARGLAADVRHVFRHEPLEAGHVGRAYHARLFFLRNRRQLIGSAFVGGALLAALAATSVALYRESRVRYREQEARKDIEAALLRENASLADARLSAETARREAEANALLVGFFRGVFERAPAQSEGGTPYSIDTALADAYEQSRVLAGTETNPELRARALTLMGSVFSHRRMWEQAAELLSMADQAYLEGGAKWTDPWTECYLERHVVLLKLGRDQEARALEDELLSNSGLEPVKRLKALNDAFSNLFRVGKGHEGRRLLEAIRRDADREDGAQRNLALSATHNLAMTLAGSEALTLLREIWEYRSRHEPELERTYRSARAIGDNLVASGRIAEGVAFIEEAVQVANRSGLGESHLEVVGLLEVKAKGLAELGRTAEAAALLESCLASRRLVHGDRHTDVLDTMYLLSVAYWRSSRIEDALQLASDGYALAGEEFGEVGRQTVRFLEQMALLEMESGRLDEGLLHANDAYRRFDRAQGPFHLDTLRSRGNQILCMWNAGLAQEALDALLELSERSRNQPEVPPAMLAWQYDNLCFLLERYARYPEAIAAGVEAVAACSRIDALHPLIVAARTHLATALLASDRKDEARAQIEMARAEAERLGIPGPAQGFLEGARSSR